MNKRQINKLRMYESVDLGFDNHSEMIDKYAELVTARQRLKAGLLAIRQNRQVQEVDRTGLTRGKKQLRSDLMQEILRFSAALMAHATAVRDIDLKTRANYTDSELKKVPDTVLYDIAVLLRGFAAPLAGELTKFFIGEAEMAEMDRLINDFKGSMPRRRAASNISKVSTGNIGSVFTSMDRMLRDEIDVLMLPFRFTQPDFYNEYRNARSIVDYTGRGKTVQPAVTA